MKKFLLFFGCAVMFTVVALYLNDKIVEAENRYLFDSASEKFPGMEKFGKINNTKEWINALELVSPGPYRVISDYFQAKTCKEDFTTDVSFEEVEEFTTTKKYIKLLALMYEIPIFYDATMKGYKFVSCGEIYPLDNSVVKHIEYFKTFLKMTSPIISISPETISLELKECDDSLSKENVCFQYTQDLRNEKAKNTRNLFSKSFSQLKLNNECEIKSEAMSDVLGDENGNQIYLKKTSFIQCRTK